MSFRLLLLLLWVPSSGISVSLIVLWRRGLTCLGMEDEQTSLLWLPLVLTHFFPSHSLLVFVRYVRSMRRGKLVTLRRACLQIFRTATMATSIFLRRVHRFSPCLRLRVPGCALFCRFLRFQLGVLFCRSLLASLLRLCPVVRVSCLQERDRAHRHVCEDPWSN